MHSYRPVIHGAAALLVVAGLAAPGPGAAQQAQPLSTAEVKSTIVGKKVEHERLSDKRIFIWDVRDSGTMFLANSSLKGKWELNDGGELCVMWDASRVPDSCYFFYKAGSAMTAGPSKTPGVMTSNIKSIK